MHLAFKVDEVDTDECKHIWYEVNISFPTSEPTSSITTGTEIYRLSKVFSNPGGMIRVFTGSMSCLERPYSSVATEKT